MKRTCRKNVFLYMMLSLLLVFVWSCASSQKKASESEKTDSSEQWEAPWKSTPSNGAEAPPTKDTETPVQYYVHTVKWQGESLSIIAGWYTGDIQNWKVLAQANPSIDPNSVVVGQKINIPLHIMTKRSPMTKAYVDSYHKPRKHKTRSSPSGTKEETPSLYGPK